MQNTAGARASALVKRRPCRSSSGLANSALPGCSHEETMVNPEILTILEQRLGRRYARQRLEIEKDHEAQVFGQGINFFHIENLPLSHVVIRAVLMATGLYRRGIRNAAKVDIRHNRIESPHLPKAFDGFTIVQLSDLHVEMSEAAMKRVIDLLGEARYDVCVLTGDYRGANLRSVRQNARRNGARTCWHQGPNLRRARQSRHHLHGPGIGGDGDKDVAQRKRHY